MIESVHSVLTELPQTGDASTPSPSCTQPPPAARVERFVLLRASRARCCARPPFLSPLHGTILRGSPKCPSIPAFIEIKHYHAYGYAFQYNVINISFSVSGSLTPSSASLRRGRPRFLVTAALRATTPLQSFWDPHRRPSAPSGEPAAQLAAPPLRHGLEHRARWQRHHLLLAHRDWRLSV